MSVHPIDLPSIKRNQVTCYVISKVGTSVCKDLAELVELPCSAGRTGQNTQTKAFFAPLRC
jgi:hypothetical protein